MNFNYQKLRVRMIEKYGSCGNFAEAYGITRQMLSYKLNNRVKFSGEEIVKMSSPEFLDIPSTEYAAYFFTPEVRNIEH